MSSALWRCCWGRIVCRDGFLALRASGCAGLGNCHTGQGVLEYQSSFHSQLALLSIFATKRQAPLTRVLARDQSASLEDWQKLARTGEIVWFYNGRDRKKTGKIARNCHFGRAVSESWLNPCMAPGLQRISSKRGGREGLIHVVSWRVLVIKTKINSKFYDLMY